MDKENLFYERLIEAVKNCGKSINCIERELGYPRNSLSNYKYGREPSGKRLIELAEYFQVTPEYIIGKSDNPNINKKYFEQLNDSQKFELYKIVQIWLFNKINMLCCNGKLTKLREE